MERKKRILATGKKGKYRTGGNKEKLSWIYKMLFALGVTLVGLILNPIATRANEWNDIELLEKVKIDGLWWEGNATAVWAPVKGANYYEVEVFVIHNDTFIGSMITGTSDTRIDLQPEIREIIGDESDFAAVYVSYKIYAEYIGDGREKVILAEGDYLDEADYAEYTMKEKKIVSFQNLSFVFNEEETVIGWDDNEIIDQVFIHLYYTSNDRRIERIDSNCRVEDLNLIGNRRYYDFSYLLDAIREDLNSEKAELKVEIWPMIKKEYSSEYTYKKKIFDNLTYNVVHNKKLLMLENFAVDAENHTISWDDNEIIATVEMGLWYLDKGGKDKKYEWTWVLIDDIPLKNNRRYYTFNQEMLSAVDSGIYEIDDSWIDIDIRVIPKREYQCEYTEYNYIAGGYNYKVEKKKKPLILKNIIINEDEYLISWDDNPALGNFVLDYEYESNGVKHSGTDWLVNNEANLIEGRRIQSINPEHFFVPNELSEGNNVKISLTAYPHTGYEKEYAIYKQEVGEFYFVRKGIKVTSINISPRTPIVYCGKSSYLGKQISPTIALYDSIEWTSDNPDIVSIDSNGKIIAKKAGRASVTAKIGDVTDTVVVYVQEFQSNIDNNMSKQIVYDTTEEIINEIINNDDPILDNTDIEASELGQLKEEIREGIENGDSFYTDVKSIQEYFDTYKSDWNQIQKIVGDLNIRFEGAYNIEVEMYHKDGNNKDHHIGNITELDNELSFTLELPEEMENIQTGEINKHVLIRIHKNTKGQIEYDTVKYDVNEDGTVTINSNKFSDFVWVVKEEVHRDDVESKFNDIK